ncbi:MAG: hypothetical protein Q7U07_06360 [Gammaproteobacteria bacterium]|nr:hypothetical protein [Gammaproteobacteria bacterium]
MNSIGKKNIVFGFIYLVFTAALGPVMLVNYFGDTAVAEAAKQEKMSALQVVAANDFEVNLEKMTAEQIAKTNSAALLALSARANSQMPIDAIKGGPHAHGNLEALLNIVVGLVLGFLAVPALFKHIISWVFIVGALGHSGLLYLAVALGLPWAQTLLASPAGYIGPSLILLGLLLAGIAAALGFKGRLVTDGA